MLFYAAVHIIKNILDVYINMIKGVGKSSSLGQEKTVVYGISNHPPASITRSQVRLILILDSSDLICPHVSLGYRLYTV